MAQEQKYTALQLSNALQKSGTEAHYEVLLTTEEQPVGEYAIAIKAKTKEAAEKKAKFIVRACNSHYELLEALKEIAESSCELKPNYDHIEELDDYSRELRQIAQAAIAKAEGK